MSDPTSWSSNLDALTVGDTFTEEWLDRFRSLMTGYNEAMGALHTLLEDPRNHAKAQEVYMSLLVGKSD